MSTRNSIMSLGIIALVVLVHPVSVPAALVDHYEFEGNGVDSQGGDANGTDHATGTVTYATGQIGKALDATQTNHSDYLVVPQANAFDPGSGDFSMAFWSQRSTFNDFDTVFDALPDPPTAGYQALFMNNGLSNRLRVRLDDDDGKTKNIDTAFSFNDAEFHHVAIVVDRVDDTATFYVDGNAETPVSIAFTGDITPDQELRLGISHDGLIDDLRFYNHALTEAEVTALIPEPATMSLLAIGGLGVLLKRRRRRA